MKQAIDKFLQCKSIAIVGASAKRAKFGNLAHMELSKKDFNLYLLHPKAKRIDGKKCYQHLDDIKKSVEAVLISVQPEESEKIVQSAHKAGIKNVWLQQGAQSDKAIQYCKDNDINVVHNEYILMHAEPVKSFHRVHRMVWKVLGKLPT